VAAGPGSRADPRPGARRVAALRLPTGSTPNVPGTFLCSSSVSILSDRSSSAGSGLERGFVDPAVVAHAGEPAGKPTPGAGSAGGPSQGNTVALRWADMNGQEAWDKKTVGEIIDTPASELAKSSTDYAELASLGEQTIPTIMLNTDFVPLKKYLAGRSKQLDTLDSPKERYAVGVGVALLLLKDSTDDLAKTETVSEKVITAAQQAAAKAVLAVMPAFDELSKAAGLDESSDDEDG